MHEKKKGKRFQLMIWKDKAYCKAQFKSVTFVLDFVMHTVEYFIEQLWSFISHLFSEEMIKCIVSTSSD